MGEAINPNAGAGPSMFNRLGAVEAANGTGSGPSPEDQAAHDRQEAEAAKYQREETFDGIIKNTEKASEIIRGVRKTLEQAKDSNTPESLEDPWGIRNMGKYLYQKRLALQMTGKELEDLGWIKGYDEDTGDATLVDRRAAGFAIKMEEKPTWVISRRERNPVTGQVVEIQMLSSEFTYKFGTPKERKELARKVERIYLEMGNDTIIGAYLGNQRANRDALDYLTGNAYSRLPHFTNDQLKALVNRMGIKEIDNNPEDNTLGKQDEVAMWWYLAMMACETKAGLVDFLDRPATDALVLPGATKEDRTRFLKTMFGNYDGWTDAGRTAKTLAQEVKDKKRGPVSMYGNIPARGRGDKYDFDYDKELVYIQDLIGKMPGSSVDSSWYASCVLRVFSEFSINGTANFEGTAPKGTAPKDLVRASGGADTHLQSNDEFKFTPEYELKEYASGRIFGPEGMVGKVPQMALSYLDHAQIRVGYTTDKDGIPEPITYPMRLAWLGDKARNVVDKGTGKTVPLAAVPYTPIGQLKYGTLPRGDFEAFTQLHALAAREGWVYDQITAIDFEPKNFLEKSVRELRKRFSIIYHSFIVFKGDTRGQTEPGSSAGKVAMNTVSDLLDAREKTEAYLRVAMSSDIDIFEPGMAGGEKNRVKVGLANMYQRYRDKLGLRRDAKFNPADQSLKDWDQIRQIPKMGGKEVPSFKNPFGSNKNSH